MLKGIGLLAAVMFMAIGAGCGDDGGTNQTPNGLNFGASCNESTTDNTCYEVYCAAGQEQLCDLALQEMQEGDCHGAVSTSQRCPAADRGMCTLPFVSGYEAITYYYAPFDDSGLAAGCAASGGTYTP